MVEVRLSFLHMIAFAKRTEFRFSKDAYKFACVYLIMQVLTVAVMLVVCTHQAMVATTSLVAVMYVFF